MDNFNEFGHPPIAPENQLCITLYVLGTPDSYRANIMEARYGFPGVIGMVDGTHIPISAPKIDKQVYINRSVHDNRVFRYSGVQQKGNDEYFPENTHLLGDKACTLQKHLMTPFIDNGHLTNDKLPMRRTDLIPHYIMAVCILHNICLKRQDYFVNVDQILLPDEVDYLGPLDETNESKATGAAKRVNLVTILNRDVEL
ncbi:hypothetical protein PV325_004955 [Microctonus aethiopoides]|nr:hypothetical protein PV325_004955 [Microctonus aethiopoides]